MFKRIRIRFLKYRARCLAHQYNKIRDNYSCGNSLANYMNPMLKTIADEFDAVVNEIKKHECNKEL